jgi:hypothetical protein
MPHVAVCSRPLYVTLALRTGSFAIAIQAAAAAGILASFLSLIAIALGLFAMLELRLWVDFHWPEFPGS